MCLRNVLAVLEDGPERLWSTFAAAVDLADAERARLTLVKTREVRQLCMWCGPFGAGGLYVPPGEPDAVRTGTDLLARAAEFVPMDIPVTTIMLGPDTARELRRLVETGAYDAVVASAPLLGHARRLRRECCRDAVRTIAVAPLSRREPELKPVAPRTPQSTASSAQR